MPEDFTSSSEKECHIGGYRLLGTIGKGSFAKVMLAYHTVTGTQVAVKIVNRQGSPLGFGELHCLQNLNHPNITKLFEVIATEDHYYLFMEHLSGGELFEYLEKYGAQTEEEARTLFRQLLSALHYCHQKGFVHRDLKPENILLDADFNIKLADFGFSKEFKNKKLTSFCGTPLYVAPEILSSQPYDGPKADIWSLGVILYQMVTGNLPFDGESFGEVKRNIMTGHLLLPYFISEECQDLLKKILTLDPAQRPTLDTIIKDPWVNSGQTEEVKLYHEPPCGDVDPHITEKMKHLGYNQEEVRESEAHDTYNNIMGTYLILHNTKMNIKGHTVQVRPCSFPDQKRYDHATPELRAVGEKRNRPSSPPTNVGAKVAISATSMAPRVTVFTNRVSVRGAVPDTCMAPRVTVSTSVAHRVAIPATDMEVMLAVTSASKKPEVPMTTTSGHMELPVLSASEEAELAILTTSGHMELADPSASPEAQVAIPTTNMEPRADVSTTSGEAKVTIQPVSDPGPHAPYRALTPGLLPPAWPFSMVLAAPHIPSLIPPEWVFQVPHHPRKHKEQHQQHQEQHPRLFLPPHPGPAAKT